jgi:hypothetical protein
VCCVGCERAVYVERSVGTVWVLCVLCVLGAVCCVVCVCVHPCLSFVLRMSVKKDLI